MTTSGIKEFVYFKVKAADNFRLSHTIKLNNINFETKSEETYKLDASTATVTGPEVYEPTGVEFVVTSPLNGTLTFCRQWRSSIDFSHSEKRLFTSQLDI